MNPKIIERWIEDFNTNTADKNLRKIYIIETEKMIPFRISEIIDFIGTLKMRKFVKFIFKLGGRRQLIIFNLERVVQLSIISAGNLYLTDEFGKLNYTYAIHYRDDNIDETFSNIVYHLPRNVTRTFGELYKGCFYNGEVKIQNKRRLMNENLKLINEFESGLPVGTFSPSLPVLLKNVKLIIYSTSIDNDLSNDSIKEIVEEYGKFYTYVAITEDINRSPSKLNVVFQLIPNEQYYETIGAYKSILEAICKTKSSNMKMQKLMNLANDLQINISDVDNDIDNVCDYISEYISNLIYDDFA